MPASNIVMSSVGTTIALSAAAPTALTAAAYATLTYTEVEEADSIGEMGPEDNVLTRTPLKTGTVDKTKGSTDYGDFPIEGGFIPGTAPGQRLLEAARKAKARYSFKKTFQDGSIEYFQGIVTSFKKNSGGAEDFTNFTSMVSVVNEPIFVPAT